jgi:hypothetical protein
MNEILDLNGQFHLTSLKFYLEYDTIIEKDILYKHIMKIIDRKNIFIGIAYVGSATRALVYLDKQPNWKRRAKFLYEKSIPKIYNIKGSFVDELNRFSDVYPSSNKRLKKTCIKCNEEKDIYNFSVDRTDCKSCEPLTTECIKQFKIVKNVSDTSDPIQYTNALISIQNEKISRMEKEITLLRNENRIYLDHLSSMYNIDNGKLTPKEPPITYKSGFTVIFLGQAFILANIKTPDVLPEFYPPPEHINSLSDKSIIYFGYHEDTEQIFVDLYNHYVSRHSINKELREVVTLNGPKDINEKIMAIFSIFMTDEYMENNFINIKSNSNKVKDGNVRMCSNKMISVIKYFLNRQIKMLTLL